MEADRVDDLLSTKESDIPIVQITFRRNFPFDQSFKHQFDDSQEAGWTAKESDQLYYSEPIDSPNPRPPIRTLVPLPSLRGNVNVCFLEMLLAGPFSGLFHRVTTSISIWRDGESERNEALPRNFTSGSPSSFRKYDFD